MGEGGEGRRGQEVGGEGGGEEGKRRRGEGDRGREEEEEGRGGEVRKGERWGEGDPVHSLTIDLLPFILVADTLPLVQTWKRLGYGQEQLDIVVGETKVELLHFNLHIRTYGQTQE